MLGGGALLIPKQEKSSYNHINKIPWFLKVILTAILLPGDVERFRRILCRLHEEPLCHKRLQHKPIVLGSPTDKNPRN